MKLNNSVSGRDYKEITGFWDTLFEQMGIPEQQSNSPEFNIHDYRFFDITDSLES